MHDVNGALLLNVTFFCGLPVSFAALVKISIFPLTAIYASLLSHKSDLSIDVSNLIFLFTDTDC